MKPLRIMAMMVLMLLFSALLYATDHECNRDTNTGFVCLPEDPQSTFECTGDGDVHGWQVEGPWCYGFNEVCCQDGDAVGGAFCCCRQLDCKIGSKRCFGDDMIQKCSNDFPGCVEWIPIKWCPELGSNYRCQNAECVEIAVDGDHTDGDQSDADKDLDSISEDGDQIDADKDLDLIGENDENEEQSSGGLKSNGCHLLDGSTAVGFSFIALLIFMAIFRKNRSSDV